MCGSGSTKFLSTDPGWKNFQKTEKYRGIDINCNFIKMLKVNLDQLHRFYF